MTGRAVRPAPWITRGVLGAGLLAGTWYGLRSPALQRLDVRVGDAVRHRGSPSVDRAVTATTDLGSMYAVLGMSAALAAAGRRRTAADVLGVGVAAWNLSQANKTRVRRARPYEADGVRRLVRPPTGSSFPSGHAAVGAAVMTVLAEAARGRAGRRLLAAIGVYVPLSRVYVGVHYPTDVLGGAGMGLALGAVWRGPVAAISRAAVAWGWRAAVPVVRLAAWAAFGVRLHRRAVSPPAAAPAAA
ncbi:MAG: phosphatase PAP2 family protein [Euzebyaceae bacterium]|nr:phosphatase PAP2 family protein [Euzebyaceae bacterium]